MESDRTLPAEKDLKANRTVTFLEYSFRVSLVVLAIAGYIKNDIIHVYHGSLQYHALMTLCMSFVPDLLRGAAKTKIIVEFRYFFLLFLFLSQVLGEIADLYVSLTWWDKLVHIVSAGFFTVVGYIIVYSSTGDETKRKKSFHRFAGLFAFSFSMTIGLFWEIFEYLMDMSFGFKMQKSGLVDTMEDIIVCVAGALIPCAIYIYGIKTGSGSFILKTIERYMRFNAAEK